MLIQSGAEELVFRVFVYQRLRKIFPKWPAVAIVGNGLIFMLVHLINQPITTVATVMMILVSIAYSLIVYFFDSIWIPIIAHTTWNFTQAIVLGLPNSGIVGSASMFKLDASTDNFAYDSFFGIEGAILTIVLYIIIALVFYISEERRFRNIHLE